MRIGVNRAALNVGRITASVRRTDATDFRGLEGACTQGEVNEPALAVVEVGDSTPRFDVSVRVDGRAPRRMALRNEDGATACVRVGSDRVGSWARALSAGRYELLTDLQETGTYDIVVSTH